MRAWSEKTEIAARPVHPVAGIARGKFFDWKKRYGPFAYYWTGGTSPTAVYTTVMMARIE